MSVQFPNSVKFDYSNPVKPNTGISEPVKAGSTPNEWDRLDFKGKVKAVGVFTAAITTVAVPLVGLYAWGYASETCFKLGPDATFWDRFSVKNLVIDSLPTFSLCYIGGSLVNNYQSFKNAKTLTDKVASAALFTLGLGLLGSGLYNLHLQLNESDRILYPNHPNDHYVCLNRLPFYTIEYFSPEEFAKR